MDGHTTADAPPCNDPQGCVDTGNSGDCNLSSFSTSDHAGHGTGFGGIAELEDDAAPEGTAAELALADDAEAEGPAAESGLKFAQTPQFVAATCFGSLICSSIRGLSP